MSKPTDPQTIDSSEANPVEKFRQDLESELDKAIDHHEFKMVYIGIATLVLFAGVIYASVRYDLPFF